MAPDQFSRYCLDDVREREQVRFLSEPRMVDDLEQEIAEFILEGGHVVTLDGIGDLVGFLDRERCDALEALLEVPRAARSRRPKSSHDFDETGYVSSGLDGRGWAFLRSFEHGVLRGGLPNPSMPAKEQAR